MAETRRRAHQFTPERIELLKQLWEAGLSASQIASELGGVTRNAVIGKVHRLGLRDRTKNPAKPSPSDLESIRKVILSSTEAPSDKHHKPLLELNEGACHWPIGSPDSSEFKFCGAPTLAGLPYCAAHARIAYNPASERRQRPKE
ncbi:GcrA family cell cycle regulator [Bradyrhizobium brasilense]|uniref:GcrA family cell cycle regulator n=1 Tax=Bradyrhizobium brasilense TaxID=1419277 RepID=A0ABY8JT68_9BRAD|nr:GcrA family cell cycle regulator [Bradyrhizobium brasilense]WFU68273.1 GcrA family cell cycle regulator [Bradyrhizobium brasilense]